MNVSFHRIRGACAGLSLLFTAVPSAAHADSTYNAKSIMDTLPADARKPYLTGVVEGLAYARFQRDGKKTEGMKCIYDWFFENKEMPDKVLDALSRFPTYTPGAIMGAMIEKKCGE